MSRWRTTTSTASGGGGRAADAATDGSLAVDRRQLQRARPAARVPASTGPMPAWRAARRSDSDGVGGGQRLGRRQRGDGGGGVPAGAPGRQPGEPGLCRRQQSGAAGAGLRGGLRRRTGHGPTSSSCSTPMPSRWMTRSGRWRAFLLAHPEVGGVGAQLQLSRWPVPARRVSLPGSVATLVRPLSAAAAAAAGLAAERALPACAVRGGPAVSRSTSRWARR